MSGLVFKGDVIYSTGEYLPAPYINKIFVREEGLEIESFIFLDDYNDVDLVDSDKNITNSKFEYKNKVLGELNYYVLLMEGFSPDIYKSIIDRDTNPIVFYHKYFEEIDKGSQEYDGTAISLGLIEAVGDKEVDFFSETGNRITAYLNRISTVAYPPKERAGTFEKINYVFYFSSTFDYFSESEELERDDFNSTLFDLQFGDISYEEVYRDGTLFVQDSVKFFDVAGDLYEKVPLQSIDSEVYKINSITHEDIKRDIENLLNDYSVQYKSDFGNFDLKNVMNAIYATLETHGNSHDVVVRLENIRKSFPNKTPIATVGKLYKRFSQRLYRINKTITESERVFKKITYNTKIVNLLEEGGLEPFSPSSDETSTCLYSDWQCAQTSFNPPDNSNICITGYFFFDYEKALRTRSQISQFLNVNRLESLGIHIPYENFQIENTSIQRDSSTTITADFASDSFPYVNANSYGIDCLITIDSEFKENMVDSLYGSDAGVDEMMASNGYISSLVNRSYTGIYDSVSDIPDYRMICFEFLEYLNGTVTPGTPYEVKLTVTDSSSQIISAMKMAAESSLQQIRDYQELAGTECVFNSDLGRFNEFFLEGALAVYASEPESAPWYTAAVSYALHLDIFYNKYDGDMDKIQNAAKEISAAINPKDGTIDAIDNFATNYADMIDSVYGDFEDSDPVEIEFSVNLPIARMLAFSSGFVGSSGGVTEPEEETDLEMEDGIEETASELEEI